MSWGLDGGPSLGSLMGDRTRGQPLEPLISWLTHVLLIAINTQENSSIPTSHVTTTATRLADTVTGRALCDGPKLSISCSADYQVAATTALSQPLGPTPQPWAL